MYVVMNTDTASEGFGGLASRKGWLRPTQAGWLVFASWWAAHQWAWNNVGPNKYWQVERLLQEKVSASPF